MVDIVRLLLTYCAAGLSRVSAFATKTPTLLSTTWAAIISVDYWIR